MKVEICPLHPARSPKGHLLPLPSPRLLQRDETFVMEAPNLLQLKGGMVQAAIPTCLIDWVANLLNQLQVLPEDPKWGLVRRKFKDGHIRNPKHATGLLREYLKEKNREHAKKLQHDQTAIEMAMREFDRGASLREIARGMGVSRATFGMLLVQQRFGKKGYFLLKKLAKCGTSALDFSNVKTRCGLHQSDLHFMLRVAKECEGDVINSLTCFSARECSRKTEQKVARHVEENLELVSSKEVMELHQDAFRCIPGFYLDPNKDNVSLVVHTKDPEVDQPCISGSTYIETKTETGDTKSISAGLQSADHFERMVAESMVIEPSKDPTEIIEKTESSKNSQIPGARVEQKDLSPSSVSANIQSNVFRDHVRDESEIRDYVEVDVTPDLMFTRPCLYDGVYIRWVEAKSSMVVPGISSKHFVGRLRRQLQSYVKFLGPGIVFWERGYTEAIETLVPGVLHRTGVKGAYTKCHADDEHISERRFPVFSFDHHRILSKLL